MYVAMFLFYLVIVGIWAYGYLRARATRSWPVTTGRVLKSGFETFTTRNRNHFYEPKVVYEYMVDGKTYQCTRILMGKGFANGNPDDAAEKIQPYKVGSDVQVYYNPANPPDAVLEHGTAGSLGLVIAPVVIIIVIVLVSSSTHLFG